MKFNEPLGLPAGTVRAVIAIMVIGSAIVSIFLGSVAGDNRTFLFGLAGVAFGYYFGARQSETADKPKSEPLDAPPPPGLGMADDIDTEGRIVSGKEIEKEQSNG